MKLATTIPGIIAAMIAFGSSAAYAACNNLTISLAVSGHILMPAGEIHGHVESASPSMIVYGNTGYYGPDARVSIYQGDSLVSLIQVQQNYCLLEAGTVTVKTVSGKKFNSEIIEGSFADGRGGKVIIRN